MEVLVTAVIIAIGVSGMGVLLLKAIKGTQDSSQQSQAMWMVQDYAGRIRANPDGARAHAYELAGEIDCAGQLPAMCAEYTDNGAEMAAAYCSADEMAVFDRWVTVCGVSPDVYDSPADFIIKPILTSTCTLTENRVSTSSGLQDCVQYNLELEWTTKIQQGGDLDEERDYVNTYSMVVELN